jgi:hypothetical protein
MTDITNQPDLVHPVIFRFRSLARLSNGSFWPKAVCQVQQLSARSGQWTKDLHRELARTQW